MSNPLMSNPIRGTGGRVIVAREWDPGVWYRVYSVPIQTWLYEPYIQLGPPVICLLGLLRLTLISLRTTRVVSSLVIRVFFIIPG